VNAPVSIREVAAHAGVSVGTVSNVLNRPETVARATRDRVHAAIKALGFIRNESARQLRAGRSRTIGLVVLDVANPFFTDVARGVEDEASTSGLAVILCNTDELGRMAAQLLVEEALGTGGHQHRQVIFRPELEIRQSSQGPPRPARRRRPAARATTRPRLAN
jgi:DNA-binding LacI/PurR family transcriptional regulator